MRNKEGGKRRRERGGTESVGEKKAEGGGTHGNNYKINKKLLFILFLQKPLQLTAYVCL